MKNDLQSTEHSHAIKTVDRKSSEFSHEMPGQPPFCENLFTKSMNIYVNKYNQEKDLCQETFFLFARKTNFCERGSPVYKRYLARYASLIGSNLFQHGKNSIKMPHADHPGK
jgi:hypothetical protein